MTSVWSAIPLGEIAPARCRGLPEANAEVWNLSLDDVESATGRILRKTRCRVRELGSAKCSFDSRCVLYSKLRPYLNKVVLPDEAGVGTSELIPLLPDEEQLDREFLAFYLRSPQFLDFAKSNTRGANLPRIAMLEFWKHKVPVPSLDEQRRIVTRIKECLERVEDIERLRHDVAKEQNAVLASARHDAFTLDAPLYEFGAILSDGPTNGLYKHAKFYGTGTRILRIDNFSGGEVFHGGAELRRLTVDEAELRRYSLEAGDIVLNRVNGSLDVVGKACLIGSLSEDTVFESNMMRFAVDPKKAEHRYVLHFLSSPNCRDQIKSKAKVIQQASINQKDVASLVLPLPQVAEQRRIADRLDKVRAVVEGIRTNTADQESSTSMLRESILRKAFAGEL